MDWKLIFGLSLFGLAMAIATVFVIPSNVEPAFWLVIFLVCAFLIARQRSTGHFLHGLLVGLVNCVWVTGAHILFFDHYLAAHPKEAAMMKSMPLPDSPRLMMALIGPIVGVVSGIIIGLLAYIAGKFVKPQVAASAEAAK
jgi:Mn2+/Fe2+ NRAMP family transporter